MTDAKTIIHNLKTIDYPDPTDILCEMANPAEADMMRMLALHILYDGDIPSEKAALRLGYTQPWGYYNLLFDEKWDSPQQKKAYSEILIKLYADNPFALRGQGRAQSPYHPSINQLPIFFKKDGGVINLQGGKLYDLIRISANCSLDFRDILPLSDLQKQLYDLNSGTNISKKRADHMDHYLEVLKIDKHPYFDALSGQRGVFAKRDIPKGTILGYYSGDHARLGDDMPPLLCSWPIATYKYKMSFLLGRHFIQSYLEWTDGYILGNMMKLVNTAAPKACARRPIKVADIPHYANTACYFGHFSTLEATKYITLPFYITFRGIKAGEEIMTFYPL